MRHALKHVDTTCSHVHTFGTRVEAARHAFKIADVVRSQQHTCEIERGLSQRQRLPVLGPEYSAAALTDPASTFLRRPADFCVLQGTAASPVLGSPASVQCVDAQSAF
jgi:hypothetical protein